MSFALVKWCSGKEEGTYTVINSDWIMEVDVKTFNNKEGTLRLRSFEKDIKMVFAECKWQV